MLPEASGDWDFHLTDTGYFLFEAHSPAGEDLIVEGECSSPDSALDDIKARVREAALGFDVDAHVDMWSDARGFNGVPATYRELVEDADAIGSMLGSLCSDVSRWELPELSDRTDCPVCGSATEPETHLMADGVVDVVRCPRCFYAATELSARFFWGLSDGGREEHRKSMIRQYEEMLDSWLAESEG